MSGELGNPKGSFDPKTRGPIVEGNSVTQQTAAHSDEINAGTGRKAWEGEHNVKILSKGMPWDAKIEIDGKPIDRNTQRIEIDLDCEKAQAIVQVTRITTDVTRVKQELLANLLDLTLDECLVVDKILEQARKEASSNSLATQLFAINETDEEGETTTHILSSLIMDAKRYRALQMLASEPDEYLLAVTGDGSGTELTSPQTLDEYSDMRRERYAQQRRAEKAQQS